MDTLTIRLSGKDQATQSVEGITVGGLFVHHPVCGEDKPQAWRDQWVITHSESGMSLGCWFDRRFDALCCANSIVEYYDVDCSAKELLEQFKTRGEKPSVADLAEENGMVL